MLASKKHKMMPDFRLKSKERAQLGKIGNVRGGGGVIRSSTLVQLQIDHSLAKLGWLQ